VTEVVEVMKGFGGTWGIAGGWALDLHLGRVTRDHSDVDVAVLRDEQQALRAHLADFSLNVVERGAERPWAPGERLVLPLHEVIARRPEFKLELLLNESSSAQWRYRRNPAITAPLSQVFLPGPIPRLAPEVVLLFKSKMPRPKDDADARLVIPTLSASAWTWLSAAIPGHAWLSARG
jgi:hypothetical protein